jgi:hypothetical protein
MLTPELVDEALGGDGLVRPEQEQGQERALIPAAERNGCLPVENLEGTEDPELQHCIRVVTGITGR